MRFRHPHLLTYAPLSRKHAANTTYPPARPCQGSTRQAPPTYLPTYAPIALTRVLRHAPVRVEVSGISRSTRDFFPRPANGGSEPEIATWQGERSLQIAFLNRDPVRTHTPNPDTSAVLQAVWNGLGNTRKLAHAKVLCSVRPRRANGNHLSDPKHTPLASKTTPRRRQ